jgi:hypothetical protein
MSAACMHTCLPRPAVRQSAVRDEKDLPAKRKSNIFFV